METTALYFSLDCNVSNHICVVYLYIAQAQNACTLAMEFLHLDMGQGNKSKYCTHSDLMPNNESIHNS